jgi:hypothetical protein
MFSPGSVCDVSGMATEADLLWALVRLHTDALAKAPWVAGARQACSKYQPAAKGALAKLVKALAQNQDLDVRFRERLAQAPRPPDELKALAVDLVGSIADGSVLPVAVAAFLQQHPVPDDYPVPLNDDAMATEPDFEDPPAAPPVTDAAEPPFKRAKTTTATGEVLAADPVAAEEALLALAEERFRRKYCTGPCLPAS